MKKIIGLPVLLVLAACMNPPVPVTDTPISVTATSAALTVPPEDAPYLPNPAWQS